jgi:penicillin-binding protein 2
MYNKDKYTNRRYVLLSIYTIVALIIIARLAYLQLYDDSLLLSAENNVIRKETIYPNRGLIYDRNGNLLVYNDAIYDLMVIPRNVKQIDTLAFCKLLQISDSSFRVRMKKAKKYSRYKASIFLSQMSKEEYSYIQEGLFKYPGFFVRQRALRKYDLPIAAHILGYIGETNAREIKKSSYYKSGDFIGKSGIERKYEKILRGRRGMKYVLVDVHNRKQGSYKAGKFDTAAIQGQTITLSIDRDLQAYGERLMQNKIGSIAAIEPSTGEILALVTSPSYDPNLLVGRIRSHNYTKLYRDSLKPLINRAVAGYYPPGSTFKLLQAAIGIEEGTLQEHTLYTCQGPNSTPIKCTHNHKTPLDLPEAIQQSCNSYFWKVFRGVLDNRDKYSDTRGAYSQWVKYVHGFGLGQKFNTDIPFEKKGNIPGPSYFDKIYGKGHWNSLTVRSMSIGQGEVLVTPLQMANMVAVIANRGYYYPPHFLKKIVDIDSIVSLRKVESGLRPSSFDPVLKGMLEVFESTHGTARWYKIPDMHVGGKTGTVQNPHGEDHSLFVAIAPIENPRIAISVVVENAGFGSTWAAPIATLMIEQYLRDSTARKPLERKILEGNLLNRMKKK